MFSKALRERCLCIYQRFFRWKVIRGSRKPPHRRGVTQKVRKEDIIVSLTSFDARLPYLPATLNTLLRQRVKPNKIIVWLSCDSGSIPASVLEYKRYGIDFRHVPLDLKGHKKYYYALQEFPSSLLITVDDDILYSRDLVSSLVRKHRVFPQAVIGRRVHLITMSQEKPEAYDLWKHEIQTLFEPSYLLFCTGSGGVLYPPGSLDMSLLNAKSIKTLCLYGDDIWLKYMALLKGTRTVWAKNHYLPLIEVQHSQSVSLSTENVIGKRNDIYLNTMETQFHKDVEKSTFGEFYRGEPGSKTNRR